MTGISTAAAKTPLWPAIARALTGRCPHCGEGKLFAGYLRQVEACAICGERFGHLRADDGPAWLTVLVVGHIMVPLALSLHLEDIWPLWVSLTLWPSLTALLALCLLPRAKGLFLAVIWRSGRPAGQ